MTTRLLSAWWSCSLSDLGLEHGAVLEDGDGGHVGQGLRGVDVLLSHLPRVGVEEVEGPDDRAPQAHGQGVHRVEAGGERLRREQRPPTVDRREVLVHDRRAGAVAVEARALLGLQLEQLQHAHGFAGRGHHSELPIRAPRA